MRLVWWPFLFGDIYLAFMEGALDDNTLISHGALQSVPAQGSQSCVSKMIVCCVLGL